MLVLVERPLECEPTLIVPYLNFGVIGAGDHIWFGGMNDDRSDEIPVRLKRLHFLHGVVVEHTHLEVVAA